MLERISCRNCDSPNCEGCNIYILETMLDSGKFDCLMDEHHSITIDPESLRPKGEWVPFEQWHKGVLWPGRRCSCCNFTIGHKTAFKWCPNCGADMRGEDT